MDDREIGFPFGAVSLVDMVFEEVYNVGLADPPALGLDSVRFYKYQDIGVFI